MNKKTLLHLIAAVAIGAALRLVVDLEPLWWLAWFVPGLLLALALRSGNRAARGWVALAAAIGVTVNVPFFLTVMPLPPVLIVMTLQVMLWMLVIGTARRVVLAFDAPWTVLALPVIAVSADTLLAHFTPDGNWGSLAYTQSEVLPVAQLASVFGVGGMLFLLMLVNSALALVVHFGARRSGLMPACGAVLLVLAVTVGLGTWRLQSSKAVPSAGQRMSFGIVAIDDFLADVGSPESDRVWAQYRSRIAALAADGARMVLLPEKINVLPAEQAPQLEQRLAAIARDNHLWLVAGLGVVGAGKRNEAWWFAPDGTLLTNYLKHFMAPPEREFLPGDQFPVNRIEGVNYGVAICKDMHFGSLGRGFGARDAAVMLVPAWDFDRDAQLAANMTKLRGVENGFAIVRSSRDGLLSVSDAYGRMLAVQPSAAMPGASLLATLPVGARVPTIYTRIGDLLGWLCVAAMVALIPWLLPRGLRRRAVQPT